jgi:hypothetical protein
MAQRDIMQSDDMRAHRLTSARPKRGDEYRHDNETPLPSAWQIFFREQQLDYAEEDTEYVMQHVLCPRIAQVAIVRASRAYFYLMVVNGTLAIGSAFGIRTGGAASLCMPVMILASAAFYVLICFGLGTPFAMLNSALANKQPPPASASEWLARGIVVAACVFHQSISIAMDPKWRHNALGWSFFGVINGILVAYILAEVICSQQYTLVCTKLAQVMMIRQRNRELYANRLAQLVAAGGDAPRTKWAWPLGCAGILLRKLEKYIVHEQIDYIPLADDDDDEAPSWRLMDGPEVFDFTFEQVPRNKVTQIFGSRTIEFEFETAVSAKFWERLDNATAPRPVIVPAAGQRGDSPA